MKQDTQVNEWYAPTTACFYSICSIKWIAWDEKPIEWMKQDTQVNEWYAPRNLGPFQIKRLNTILGFCMLQ